MSDDFALIDFLLVAAPPDAVLRALAKVHAARAADASRPGALASLFRRAPRPAALRLQPFSPSDTAPLSRARIDDPGFDAGDATFRVSAPIGTGGWVLVEFREGDAEISPLCTGLAAALPGCDLFRFRLSGDDHPGSDTAFQVYRDGRAVRRVASVSAAGITPEARWRVVDVGMPHPAEADSLPGARARAWEVMTPPRQAAILAALGVDADALFAADPARRSALLSPDPSGGPFDAALALFETAAGLRQPPELVVAAVAARRAATAPPPMPDATPPSPAPVRPDRSLAPPPDTGPADTADWEDEVTALLVAAASHGLPAPEQVPWLSRLTARMEAGEVDAALAEARHLLAHGDRPAAERAADIARLDALFGPAPE